MADVVECIAQRLLTVEQGLALEADGRDSAVLIALRRQADGGLTTLLTRRRDDLPRHAGEISFPGGRSDPEDTDHLATALREAHEEMGIDPGQVRVVGALAPISTFVTDFAVYPFIGEIPADLPLTPAEGEVDAVLEIGLGELARVREKRELSRGGFTFTTEAYETEAGLVWGATGRIVGILLDRVGDCLPSVKTTGS